MIKIFKRNDDDMLNADIFSKFEKITFHFEQSAIILIELKDKILEL